MGSDNVFQMDFAKIYEALLNKAARKGRTKAEVDRVICYLDKLIDELAKGKPMEKILRE